GAGLESTSAKNGAMMGVPMFVVRPNGVNVQSGMLNVILPFSLTKILLVWTPKKLSVKGRVIARLEPSSVPPPGATAPVPQLGGAGWAGNTFAVKPAIGRIAEGSQRSSRASRVGRKERGNMAVTPSWVSGEW